jgi:hypothetical protein
MHNILLKPVLASALASGDFYADLKVGKMRRIAKVTPPGPNGKVILDFARGKALTLLPDTYVCILHAIKRG